MAKFPDGFIWGAATAGHQVEGDNVNSDTWFAEHTTPTLFKEPSGKACNSYVLWREDIDLAKSLNFNSYRFSIEWARIQPAEGEFDEKELAHYESIIDYCIELGLEPIVTLNHFTSPHWFAKLGSWINPVSAELFATYVTKVMQRYGSKLKHVVTLNEPNLPPLLTWVHMPDFVYELTAANLKAASEKAGVDNYRLSNVVRKDEFDAMGDGLEAAHIAARKAIRAAAPNVKLGLSIAIVDDRVVGDDASLRDRKREEVYGRWLRLAKDDDFIGVQNYESVYYDGEHAIEPSPDVPRNGMGSAIDPTALEGAVRYAYEQTGVPVYVTEHGLSTTDDTQRVAFIKPALVGLQNAIADGVEVLGYTHWSLLDNFEWIFGYGPKFGLFDVNFETFERTAKPSAAVLAEIVKNNAI